MNQEKSMINIKNLSKVYKAGDKEIEALKNFTLEIGHGEFVAIMGPPGSGKTTLVKILGCVDKPSGGDFQFEGKDILHLGLQDLKRIRNEKIRVEDLSEVAEDEKVRDKKVSLIVIDEPPEGAKVEESHEILEFLNRLSEVGVTVILVTNEKDLAKGVKRVVTMRKGEKVADVDLGIFIRKDVYEGGK